MSELIQNFLRMVIIWTTHHTKWYERLLLRTNFTEVGALSGHVSDLDKSAAQTHNLAPLNRFEKWFMAPYIKAEKIRRQDIFRQVIIDQLGEDPFEERSYAI